MLWRRKTLRQHPISLEKIGLLLNEGWDLKSRLSSAVSSPQIDNVYKEIMRSGAYGAKLCGAGGGGFFLVVADPAAASKIGNSLGEDKIMKVSVYNSGVELGEL